MCLLLGHDICSSSVTVKFLMTDPPATRTRTILPVYMIDDDDDNPYTIMKYMARPHLQEFENLTYFQYFQRYLITPSPPATTRQAFRDDLNNYVFKRSKEIITRHRFLRVEDAQGLTLARVCLALDGNIFSPGQAYVALSRYSSWDNLEISHLDKSAFMVDQDVILEYQRLTDISNTNPHLFS
ncbi:hypothetical protein RhiirB3_518103 [Rhizophagus irregularis]|nr:hypothetical protein RhiirB3_518103 [Rhizophagus irregularis]